MANSFDSLFSDNKELSKGALNNTANEKPFHAYIETKKTEENFSDITVFSEDQQSDAIHRYSWLKELYRLNIKAFTQNSLKDPISQIQIISNQFELFRTNSNYFEPYLNYFEIILNY